MTAAVKQDSNVSGLRFVREVSPGVLSGTDVWSPLEPNSYKSFGGQIKKVARQPINRNRQLRKGVTVDLDAMAGFQQDLTYTNMQAVAEGVFFADFRRKTELASTAVTAASGYAVASGGAAFGAADLLLASGFAVAGNNGLKQVTASTGTTVNAASLVDDASPGNLVKVGFQFASGDANIDASGAYPALKSTTKDLTTLGLVVGEWIFIGGDAAVTQFANVANRGYARVKTIAAGAITFDKTEQAFVTDAGAAKTIRVFVGRMIKNELGTLIKQYTYQFERTLGAADLASPTAEQAEYVTNALFNTMLIQFNTADKVTFDTELMASDYQQQTSVAGLKAGTRPAITNSQAFNTTAHMRRSALSIVGSATPLFTFLSDIAYTVNNNVKANKAIGTLGAFAHSAGEFQVTAACTAYFADVASVAAVRNNANVTVDTILARTNQAIVFDLPLVALGDASLKVALNTPITLPLTVDAGSAIDLDANTDYTFATMFFDYVPSIGCAP